MEQLNSAKPNWDDHSLSENPSELNQKPTLRLTRFALLKIARIDDFLDGFYEGSIDQAKSFGADMLVFCDRPWMGESLQLPLSDQLEIAVLSFSSFDEWFSRLGKDTRNEIRKGSKRGVEIRAISEPSGSEAQQIVDLFREAPFREGRYFASYDSWNAQRVMAKFRTDDRFVTTAAFYEGKIVGVAKFKFRGKVAVVNNLLSSLAVRRKIKNVANSLLAEQIKMLSDRGVRHLTYGKIGVLSGLDHFKRSNGFKPVTVNYNYILLTRKARLSSRFGFYQPKDIMFSTKLRFVVPLLGSLQAHLPLTMIQKFHLYA